MNPINKTWTINFLDFNQKKDMKIPELMVEPIINDDQPISIKQELTEM